MRKIISQGMIDALGVDFELGGDVHVLGAGERMAMVPASGLKSCTSSRASSLYRQPVSSAARTSGRKSGAA
jgi:hypothetical protein